MGDQLSHSISSLEGHDQNDLILMCEVKNEATYVKHHQKKIVFLFSSMRHFAQSLTDNGYDVFYVKLDDKDNNGSFSSEIERVLKKHPIDQIIVTFPGEYRVLEEIKTWQNKFNLDIEIRPDNRFLCSIDEFKAYANNKKELKMEFFYRQMRQAHNLLMDADKPIGGKWNYDSDNRKALNFDANIPKPTQFKPDAITKEVINLVKENFSSHFGSIENFNFAVTRDDALVVLKEFIKKRLKYFGDYQDAMLEDEPWLYHAHLSFYLNCGLVNPLECIKAAEKAYYDNLIPLNSAEGFIRQILGWREFIRGIYWLKMPEYEDNNFFNAKRKLPSFYWDYKTKMNCLSQCIKDTYQNAYAHHIQRLMVLGNFTLIAGISPKEVSQWFLIVYADAYHWVELPNVLGMILFADGGFFATKPYAAGGNYIHKMSNYCKNCHYKVSEKNGDKACPFNYLYWDFLERNRAKLENNPRVSMMYKTYDRMSEDKKNNIKKDAASFLKQLS